MNGLNYLVLQKCMEKGNVTYFRNTFVYDNCGLQIRLVDNCRTELITRI